MVEDPRPIAPVCAVASAGKAVVGDDDPASKLGVGECAVSSPDIDVGSTLDRAPDTPGLAFEVDSIGRICCGCTSVVGSKTAGEVLAAGCILSKGDSATFPGEDELGKSRTSAV
jgi:hypothetical protein